MTMKLNLKMKLKLKRNNFKDLSDFRNLKGLTHEFYGFEIPIFKMVVVDFVR